VDKRSLRELGSFSRCTTEQEVSREIYWKIRASRGLKQHYIQKENRFLQTVQSRVWLREKQPNNLEPKINERQRTML
jgi:hypothetical protein